MPALPIGPVIKLAARYGPAAAAAVKGVQNLDPAHRQRVVDVLAAADPKRRLRDRVERLSSTLGQQFDEAPGEERRALLAAWRERARALQARLALADGLSGRPRKDTYNSVKRDLELLVTDITAAETAVAPEGVHPTGVSSLEVPELPES